MLGDGATRQGRGLTCGMQIYMPAAGESAPWQMPQLHTSSQVRVSDFQPASKVGSVIA
jgi:hypothetical protein